MDDKQPLPTPNGDGAAATVAPTNGQEETVKPVGCAHYKRRAQFVTPCCNKFYMCRYCHDENETHLFNRKTVTELICTECNTRQRVQAECEKCGVRFGRYTCLVCNLFDDEDRNQYHCEGCGICRVGGRGRFFHCEVCNMCLPLQLKIDGHKCVENVSRSNCPVCLDDIHTSRLPCHIPDCGHLLHRTCFENLLATGYYACPICQTSMMDMVQLWVFLDAEVAATPMPKEYEKYYVDILCKDCHKESLIKFHVVGLKCPHCGGYNTCQTKAKTSRAETDSFAGGLGADEGMSSSAPPDTNPTTAAAASPPMVEFPAGHSSTDGTVPAEGTRDHTNDDSSNGGPSTSTASSTSSSSSVSTASSSATVVSLTGALGGDAGLLNNSSAPGSNSPGARSTDGATTSSSNGASDRDDGSSTAAPPICDNDPAPTRCNAGAAQI
uniref:Vitellogenin n=1 Tax=Anopheles atroparvus TaxID=41427 RepID=A0A182IKD6_ANOAO